MLNHYQIRVAVLLHSVAAMTHIATANEQMSTSDRPLLVIVASSASARHVSQEVILLQSRPGSTSWNATASLTNAVKAGRISKDASLEEVFCEVRKAGESESPQQPLTNGKSSFSLLLIKGGRLETLEVLNSAQKQMLRDSLAAVFDDILRRSGYRKANIMLDLLVAPSAPRATTRAAPSDKIKSVYPQ